MWEMSSGILRYDNMIINLTQNKIISKQEINCFSLLSQARGLMFRKKQNLVMHLKKEQIISLHNFFVFYPIDILIFNKNKEIIEIKRNFRPFAFYISNQKGQYVIELAFPFEYTIKDKIKI